MKHLKVKGWGFYNSIGRKVVESTKEQVKIEISTLFEGSLFSTKLGGDVCELCKIDDNYNYTYINLSSYLYGVMCGDTLIYKVDSYGNCSDPIVKPEKIDSKDIDVGYPFSVPDFIKSLEDYKCK